MELQPRTVGELLSDALALLRRHAGPIALLALPFCALELVLRDAMFSLLSSVTGGLTLDAPMVEVRDALARLFAGTIGLGFVVAVLSWLLSLGVTTMTAGTLFGQRLEPLTVARGTLRHTARVVLTALLWFATIGLVGVVLPTGVIIGLAFMTLDPLALGFVGVLGFSWFVVVLIAVGLRWALWPQAIALEGRSAVQALRRSSALMGPPGVRLAQNPKFRLSLLLLVYFMVQTAVQQLFLLPTLVTGFSQTPPFSGDLSLWSLPLYLAVPLALAQVASNSLLLPLNGILSTLFYFDLRVRHEGYDLDLPEGSAAKR